MKFGQKGANYGKNRLIFLVILVEIPVDFGVGVLGVGEGAVAELVELLFGHAGVVSEFVEEGFADFFGELFAGGAGVHEGATEEEDARGEGAGVELLVGEGNALVEAEDLVVFWGIVFDDDGDAVDPLGEFLGEGGDGGFHESVEGFSGEVHG